MAFPVARAWAGAFALLALIGATGPASALSIELKDVAADRIERQRAAAEGALPLPGTPNIAMLDERLKEKGVTLADPILIRIFKTESELEIWKLKGGAFTLFATYPICHWSGTTGPKLRSGDKQAPEGFYTLTRAQIYRLGRWPKSLNIGFPNFYDQSQARTGSDILIHGGCSSVGCFAMTNPVMDEIHLLTASALENGEDNIPVHIFPFRMTDDAMRTHTNSPWTAFWVDLKVGFDAFEASKRAPHVSVCDGRYRFEDGERPATAGPITACNGQYAMMQQQNHWLNNVPPPAPSKVAASADPAASAKAAYTVAAEAGRPTFQCPVSLPTCHRYLAAWWELAGKRAALRVRFAGAHGSAPAERGAEASAKASEMH